MVGLCGAQPFRRGADFGGRQPDKQVADGRRVAHRAYELAHHAEAAVDGDGAGAAGLVPRDQPDKCGLADAVSADDRDVLTIADAEAHVIEQRPPTRDRIPKVGHLESTHFI